MIIEKNKVVYMHYTLTDEEGEVIDSSRGHDPLPFIQGIGNIIPGLERELEGKQTGDKVKVTVSPEEGYGVINEDLTQVVPLTSFPDKEQVKVGVTFSLSTPEGMIDAQVTAVDDTNATLDFNHPLAGVTLNFDVEIMNVRDASLEEISHGHVHDGHHHHH